ncbi:hypothetical protein Fuma_05357 [Fuerstiella marisgermanici]|uniref:Uncharacterized protein n=2 Tax=Fuerstiella marisgermanici TaxID=1891926 RepID=A0A1P8WNT6_9PLAN|nr:hypothetical protein Fuma_05357 [Fuerstiella marisgermanici]
MQHDDWAASIKNIMSSSDTTVDEWEALLKKTEVVARASVGDWHVQQTLALYADFHRDKQQFEAASKLDARIGDDADEQIRYWNAASANALAHAAIDCFNGNDKIQGVALAKRALKHLGHSGEPPFPVFEKLISELRAHLEGQAKKA